MTEKDELWVKLNGQTARLDWTELQTHFARGVVIKVTAELDLVDVAVCVARDDVAKIDQWLDDGEISRATDADAQQWQDNNTEFWAVVAAPWVLVQQK